MSLSLIICWDLVDGELFINRNSNRIVKCRHEDMLLHSPAVHAEITCRGVTTDVWFPENTYDFVDYARNNGFELGSQITPDSFMKAMKAQSSIISPLPFSAACFTYLLDNLGRWFNKLFGIDQTDFNSQHFQCVLGFGKEGEESVSINWTVEDDDMRKVYIGRGKTEIEAIDNFMYTTLRPNSLPPTDWTVTQWEDI